MKKISMMIAGLLATSQAHALGLGDARVHSYLGEPLQVSVPLLLTTDERLAIDRLEARIGDRAMFERMALEYREGLARITISVEQRGADTWLSLRSVQRIDEPLLQFPLDVRIGNTRLARTINVLLDPPETARRSVDVPQPAVASPPRQPTPATSTRPQAAPLAGLATPPPPQRSGDLYGPVAIQQTLGEIAAELRPQGATLHQTLVALWQANPDAFIHNNMHKLMAGSRLQIPSARQILALDPAEARQQVLAQYHQRNNPRSIAATQAADARPAAQATPAAPAPVSSAPPAPTVQASDEPRLSLLSPAALEQIPEVFREEVQLLGSRMQELNRENAVLRDRVGDMERHIGALSQQVLLLAENTANLSSAEGEALAALQQPTTPLPNQVQASEEIIQTAQGDIDAEPVRAVETAGRSATLSTELSSPGVEPRESALPLRPLLLGGILLLSIGVGAAWYRRLRQRERYREIMHRF